MTTPIYYHLSDVRFLQPGFNNPPFLLSSKSTLADRVNDYVVRINVLPYLSAEVAVFRHSAL